MEPVSSAQEHPVEILRSVLYYIDKLQNVNKNNITCKARKVEAVIAWHVIPSVSIPHAKSVHAVFVIPVVWLFRSPEPKSANFFVCPHKGAFNTTVIEA